MEENIPLDAFTGTKEAVLLVDDHGTVRYCNRPAADLLGCDADAVVGRPCRDVAQLRTTEDEPFCGAACPVQRELRQGVTPHRHRVTRRTNGEEGRPIDLMTFVLPEGGEDWQPVLHILSPVPEAAPGGPYRRENLRLLSPRERQVLRLLAAGRSTSEVAEDLGISAVTVRNHVQRILKKLGAHNRLEAIMKCLPRRRPKRKGGKP